MYGLNSWHQVTSILTSEGEYHHQYDLAGNLVVETDPLGRVTTRSYNARGQETSITLPDPDGAGPLPSPVITRAFDPRGSVIAQTDAMGKTTHWTYDAGGRVLSETAPDPDGAGPLPAPVTSFTYDLRGLRSTVTDANGNTTGYLYDSAGRVVEEIDPRGNHTYFEYDGADQVTRVVDRNSRKKEFSYNDLGLVTQEIWVDGFGNTVKTIVHGYDDAGREVSVSDGVTAYQKQYDLADQVTQIDNVGSLAPQVTLTSAYDFEGNRTILQDSYGGGVSYTWLNQRLQSMVMTTEAGKYAGVDFTYDPVGRLGSLRRTANDDASITITTAFTRDLLDRITGITHSKVSGGEEVATILSQFGYTYDANSRVIGSTGPAGSLSFALDTSGQLLSVTGSRSENYAYDPVGNRSAYVTDEGNLIVSDGQFTYSHDLEGNLKTKTRLSDGQVTEYYWDHRNQLTKALIKNASGVILKELRFTYDVEGRRVGEWVDSDGAGPGNPDQVWTVFDGANPYMDLDVEGNIKARYLHGPGIDEIFARIGAGEEPEWYLPDRLGSVRQIVDALGSVLDDIVYNSFGGILSESNPSQGDRFKFTGREYCQELGIYYYRARWYDPSTGRFISPDPIGFQGRDPNLYRYVGNAPGDATDPEGLQYKSGLLNQAVTNQNQLIDDLLKIDSQGQLDFQQGKPFKPEYAVVQEQINEIGFQTLNYYSSLANVDYSGIQSAFEIGLGVAGFWIEAVDWGLTIWEIYKDPTDKSNYLAFLPGISIGMIKGCKKAANQIDNISNVSNSGRLRNRLGDPPVGLKKPQAHHDLPSKFRANFEKVGLDIDDPAHGRWVEGGPIGNHQKWSKDFNEIWEVFFARYPDPSQKQILDFKNMLKDDPRFQ